MAKKKTQRSNMTEIEPDQPYWLSRVARVLDVHVSTVARWATRGLRRRTEHRRLRTLRIGGRRAVMGRDLLAFVAAEADPEDLGLRSSARRRRASEAAEEELERYGA